MYISKNYVSVESAKVIQDYETECLCYGKLGDLYAKMKNVSN